MLSVSLGRVLGWYVPVAVGIFVAALSIIALTKSQAHTYLSWLGVVFALLTVGCLAVWRWTYLEMSGHFLRSEALNLANDLAVFIEDSRPFLGAHLMGSSGYRGCEREICANYVTQFFSRLDSFIGRVRNRGDFEVDDGARLRILDPENFFAIEATEKDLRIFSKAYKAQKC